MTDVPTTNRPALLQAKELSCSVDGDLLLRDISLRVGRCDVVLVVGENGSGKSVLLRALANQHRGPSTGSVVVADSASVLLASANQLSSQSVLRVQEFVDAASASFPDRSSVSVSDFGLDGLQVVSTLSTGELQRLILVMALHVQADVTLFDSPCLALDSAGIDLAEQVTRTLLDQQRAVIIATSNPEFVMRFNDAALFSLRDGSLQLLRDSAY